jgi:hypothetical protein
MARLTFTHFSNQLFHRFYNMLLNIFLSLVLGLILFTWLTTNNAFHDLNISPFNIFPIIKGDALKEQEQRPSKMPTSRNTRTKRGDDEQKHMNQQMNKSKNQPKIIMHKTLQNKS